ncbi:MAG: hypothetical protein S4CHLAM45_08710 [Chlamydiales bacterium]|nr:hypothetical protein [Chlamydiales bacterium]MCH9620379.1 hypothetical protein [Chlamydiales bacterium]MCH9622975.1 hypothetical protein [Chlamydiales bacterium]
MFTLAPIMVIWFGWNLVAIVVPTALMIFFPLTLNIYQGFRCTPKALTDFFKLQSATTWQTLIKLRLPSALPHIFAGFRISAAIAGVGAIAGEWAGAQSGLGILMLESRRNSDLAITFGALTCLTGITLSLYALILLAEHLSVPKNRIQLNFNGIKWIFAKKKWLALPLFSLLILLTGCEKKETRLLLDWLPNPNHIPLFAGVEEGFFKEEGINLKILKMFDQGGGISYLSSNQADLLVWHIPGTLKACSSGANLKIVGSLINCPLRAIIYRKDPTVQKPSDLTSKTLGYCIGGVETTFLDYLLDQGGILPSKRKNVSTDLISAMGTSAVDFIYGGFWNIEPFQLKSINVETSSFPLESLGVPSYAEMIVIGNGKCRETSLEFTQAFQRALHKSITFSKNHPIRAFEHYIKANPDKTARTIDWEREAWNCTSTLLAEDQTIDLDQLKKFYTWQLSQKILTQPVDCSSLITITP